jgi:thiamine biosynthesis lipoprotein
MASSVHAVLVDPPRNAEELLRTRLEELEARWSRFAPHSDITRLNMTPGSWVPVSPDTLALLSAMKRGRRQTELRFEPTLLGPLLDAGYVESVDGSGFVSRMAPDGGGASRSSTLDDVAVDRQARAARLPVGVGLDPGGIGKGLAADLVVAELLEAGARGALVSIGGDLAAAGTPATDEGWLVAVEDPFDDANSLMTLALDGGGVATSSTRSRTWLRDGHRTHHQIDPGTRISATTDLAAVTVIARSGWEAEVHATAALLSGGRHVNAYLRSHAIAGVAVGGDGTLRAVHGIEDDPAKEVS